MAEVNGSGASVVPHRTRTFTGYFDELALGEKKTNALLEQLRQAISEVTIIRDFAVNKGEVSGICRIEFHDTPANKKVIGDLFVEAGIFLHVRADALMMSRRLAASTRATQHRRLAAE